MVNFFYLILKMKNIVCKWCILKSFKNKRLFMIYVFYNIFKVNIYVLLFKLLYK